MVTPFTNFGPCHGGGGDSPTHSMIINPFPYWFMTRRSPGASHRGCISPPKRAHKRFEITAPWFWSNARIHWATLFKYFFLTFLQIWTLSYKSARNSSDFYVSLAPASRSLPLSSSSAFTLILKYVLICNELLLALLPHTC